MVASYPNAPSPSASGNEPTRKKVMGGGGRKLVDCIICACRACERGMRLAPTKRGATVLELVRNALLGLAAAVYARTWRLQLSHAMFGDRLEVVVELYGSTEPDYQIRLPDRDLTEQARVVVVDYLNHGNREECSRGFQGPDPRFCDDVADTVFSDAVAEVLLSVDDGIEICERPAVISTLKSLRKRVLTLAVSTLAGTEWLTFSKQDSTTVQPVFLVTVRGKSSYYTGELSWASFRTEARYRMLRLVGANDELESKSA